MSRSKVGYNVIDNCSQLSKDKTFENLYNIICSHGDNWAAMWLENGVRRHLSFNELRRLTDVWSVMLTQHFGKEGRVAISLEPCKDWFPLFWGLTRSGHDTLLIDANLPDENVASIMEKCNCSMIVSARRRKMPSHFRQVLSTELIRQAEQERVPEHYVPCWGRDIALCTSGTTGNPKIFIYDERSICDIALFSESVFKENRLLIDNDDLRTLAFLPFHHILGFAGVFIWCGFLGYIAVYLKDRAPQTIVETCKRCKVEQIITVPILANSLVKSFYAHLNSENGSVRALFSALVNFSLAVQGVFPKYGHRLAGRMFRKTQRKILGSHIKSIVIGGSHTDPETLRLLNALGYLTVGGYGMTETAITSLESCWRLQNRLKGSIGGPLGSTQYRINGGGNVGELLVKGPGLHVGRFVDGQRLGPDVDAEGWFHTGDIIRINKGARQYFIEGRIKDVIINESGENVYPDELEDLFGALEGVEQFVVLGTTRNYSRYEDITLALNVDGRIHDEAFLQQLAENVRNLNSTQPVFKRLTRLIVTSQKLPVSNSFKIKRQELKKMIDTGKIEYVDLSLSSSGEAPKVLAENKVSPTVDTSKRDEMVQTVSRIYADVLGIPVEVVKPNSHFIDDLHGDSLAILSVAAKLEETYSIIIPDEEYISCATPVDAANMLSRLIYGESQTTRYKEMTPITHFEDSEEYKVFRQRRDALLESGDDPYFVSHESPLRDTCIINGKEYIDFGNYNYAGMSGRPEVSEAAKRAIDQYGTSSSGSRLLAGEKPVHGELERAIAEWKHAEAAVVCVGGHSTNVTFVGNFCGKNDLILYDALAHNSVAQGCKLSDAVTKSFPHNDVKALETMLQNQRRFFEKVLIVIEGVYSMDGDIADVPAFVALKKKYGCFLMVDEAHSACVLGPTGAGVDEYFNLAPDDIDIKMGTLSKGLGTCGGYLAGSKALIEYLKYNLPGFVFSVGISPGLAAASLEAIRLLRTDPSIMQRMQRNIECFATEARKRNLNICLGGKSAILPIMVGRDEDAFLLSNELNHRGIAVPPAVYPAVPKGKARLRFGVTSEHKPEQIVFALDTLLSVAKELNIQLPTA